MPDCAREYVDVPESVVFDSDGVLAWTSVDTVTVLIHHEAAVTNTARVVSALHRLDDITASYPNWIVRIPDLGEILLPIMGVIAAMHARFRAVGRSLTLRVGELEDGVHAQAGVTSRRPPRWPAAPTHSAMSRDIA
ncbi:MAG: hypothetical protein JXR94_21175 [Candidatus Hydrogenedentes bacterium]|nr:hypothetical protein [Candidatus Hydrogenedentota bacterium]